MKELNENPIVKDFDAGIPPEMEAKAENIGVEGRN